MEIRRGGAQPSAQAAAEHFTGAVRIDPLFQPRAPLGAQYPATFPVSTWQPRYTTPT